MLLVKNPSGFSLHIHRLIQEQIGEKSSPLKFLKKRCGNGEKRDERKGLTRLKLHMVKG
ncbi:unnamed protein product [Cuscuta epithymum]|uniref:Uncharacterized protein n=1 Tax=Cuscuta epithymum TaxID=186058 RepID=A0AAV0GDN1_9ASTE|nr:unnamed protein product [Cuscuta epithymum]